MKKQLKNALYYLPLLFLGACASIGSPTGGPKDVQAPELLSSNPRDGQTNVKPESIVLQFSEPIQTIDIYRQLIIAPYMEPSFKERIKDGRLELIFDKPWQENTTYSFNFRNSIVDVTEKNVAKNAVIKFSTGDKLDSGSVSGTVAGLFSLVLPKEVNVQLYPTQDTAQLIGGGRPLYVTSVDSTGAFSFNNIKVGNYFVYALAETNANLRYDKESELLAYATDSIQVNPSAEGVKLILHAQDTTAPRIITRRSFLNLYEVEYTEGVEEVKIQSLEGGERELLWIPVNNGKVVRLFPIVADEQKILIQARDSAANQRVDTVAIRLTGKAAPRSNNSFEIINGGVVKPTDTLKLRFEAPTKIVDPVGAVTLVFDTTETVTTTNLNQLKWNKNQTELTLQIPLQAKKEVEVSIDTTKIVPVVGAPYAKSKQTIQVSERTNTGSLKVVTDTQQKSYVIQLLRDGKIVRQAKNVPSVVWERLQPGKYNIRILVDSNNNGKWDNGNLRTRRQPEPVILHPEELEIRADWEIEISPPISF